MTDLVTANVDAYLKGVTSLYRTAAWAKLPRLPFLSGSRYWSGMMLAFSSRGSKSRPSLVAPYEVPNQQADVPMCAGMAMYQYFFTSVLNFW